MSRYNVTWLPSEDAPGFPYAVCDGSGNVVERYSRHDSAQYMVESDAFRQGVGRGEG